MLHFSCDLCGQPLDDRRYVVKLETFPAFDPDELTEEDLAEDNLQAVAKLIQEIERTGADPLEGSDAGAKSCRFDLCPRCHAKFARDPLGRDSVRRLNFSKN
jgi:hypothetical protein